MSEVSLEAEIELLPTGAGGRRHGIRTGFRPALWFGNAGPDGEPELHSAILRLGDNDALLPGERGRVRISPIAYETWPHLMPGSRFDVYDGGRPVGTGTLQTTPTQAGAERELRRALNDALEEWVIERFGKRVAHRPRVAGHLQPDLIAWFSDDAGERHSLVGEVVARKPRKRDVDRLATMMKRMSASLGLLVALEDPSAATLDAIYRYGTVAISADLWVPRIRVISTRDLARGNVELLPTKREPEALELLAS